MRHVRKKCDLHIGKKERAATEPAHERTKCQDLTGFKVAIINMFKEVNKVAFKSRRYDDVSLNRDYQKRDGKFFK